MQQNNIFKAREEKYQSRINVLEALASGSGEENEVMYHLSTEFICLGSCHIKLSFFLADCYTAASSNEGKRYTSKLLCELSLVSVFVLYDRQRSQTGKKRRKTKKRICLSY